MILIINNREVKLNVGVRFLKEMNNRFSVKQDGVPLGFGLNQIAISFSMGDVSILVDMIESATQTARPYKPTREVIEEYLDALDDYDTLIEEFTQELSEANATKKQWTELMKEVQVTEVEEPKTPTTKKSTKK